MSRAFRFSEEKIDEERFIDILTSDRYAGQYG